MQNQAPLNTQASNKKGYKEEFLEVLSGNRCITYEISPKRQISLNKIFNLIKESNILDKIDGFTCTDSPLGKLKHSSILASIKTQEFFKKPTICTISLRDRNSLALSSEILGLNEFDIRLFLALSGDPLKLGDQPQAKSVFEGNSLTILKLIKNLNEGYDLALNKIAGGVKPIAPFATINSYARNMSFLKQKLLGKIESGALAIFTQPIYDIKTLDLLLFYIDDINKSLKTNATLIAGFFPVTRYKSALFLRSKLPGVYIPDEWIASLHKASLISQEEEYKIGLELSSCLFTDIYARYKKIHIMGNNPILTKVLLDSI